MIARITADLNHILDHVEALGSLENRASSEDASAVLPCTRSAEADTPDALHRSLEALAPAFQDGFFVVPPLPGVHADGKR